MDGTLTGLPMGATPPTRSAVAVPGYRDLESVGLVLVAHLAVSYVLASLVLILGGDLRGRMPEGVILAAALGVTALGHRAWGRRALAYVAAVAAAWAILAGALAFVPDYSCDGQTYHQEAIAALLGGWNPYHQAYDGAGAFGPDAGFASAMAIWIDHYANASWMLQALVVGATGSLDAGKGLQAVLCLGSGMIAFGALVRLGCRQVPAAALASVAALNPVAVTQMPTHYLDGSCASLFLVLVASASVRAIKGPEPGQLAAMAASSLLLVNFKFTMLPMAAVICLGFLAWTWAGMGRRRALADAGIIGLVFAVAVLATGYAPYVRNTFEHGHPFYPVMGPGKVDILGSSTPDNISRLPRPLRPLASVFSETANPLAGASSRLKVPFTFTRQEMAYAGVADNRTGGFGPFFSGICLLAGLLLAWRFPATPRAKVALAAACCIVAASALIHPDAWWARYVPQVWILPCLPVACALAQRRRLLGAGAICAVMAANIAACAVSAAWISRNNALAVRAQDAALSAAPPFKAYFGDYTGTYLRMKAEGIRVTPVADVGRLDCESRVSLVATGGMGVACR